jgi:NitT/TauT family transport system substrate-binding protein
MSEADRIAWSASPFRRGNPPPRIRPALAVGLVASFIAGACGGAADGTAGARSPATSAPSAASPAGPPTQAVPTATSVRVQLRGTIRAEFAGFIAAIDEGYYEAADIEVTLVEAGPGVDAVAEGSANSGPEFTVAWVPAVLERRGKGKSDLVDIAQVFQRSGTLSLSWRDADITGPRGFRDRKVGIFEFGDGLEVVGGAIRAGLKPGTDFTTVAQPSDLDGPIDRDLDVAQATTYDGYARVLESTNPRTHALYESTDMHVINWYDEGTAMLQDAIFARASWLALDANAAIAERFLKATFQGWIHCRDHPAGCVEAVIAAGTKPVVTSGTTGGASAAPSGQLASPGASGDAPPPLPRPTFGAGHHSWAMNEVNALVWPSPEGIGIVDAALWQHTADVCLETGFIPSAPPDDAVRNDLARAALADLVDIDTAGLSYAKSTIEITPDGG